MENQDSSIGFWIDGILVPDANGECKGNSLAGYAGRIKVSLGKAKRDGGSRPTWRMSFKTVIAQHIIDKLKGRQINRSRGGMNAVVSTTSYEWMLTGKTISAFSLERLQADYDAIVQDFLFVLSDEKSHKEKCIFVDFKHSFNPTAKSSGNGAGMGRKMSMSYNYFVGYYNGKTIYDCDYKPLNTISYDKEVLDYNRIPWTQEREDFFNLVYDNFDALKDKLATFFAGIDANTIDSVISNFKLIS